MKIERHKSGIPVKRAEYVLLGPELEQLAKRSGAGLLGGGGSYRLPYLNYAYITDVLMASLNTKI